MTPLADDSGGLGHFYLPGICLGVTAEYEKGGTFKASQKIL